MTTNGTTVDEQRTMASIQDLPQILVEIRDTLINLTYQLKRIADVKEQE